MLIIIIIVISFLFAADLLVLLGLLLELLQHVLQQRDDLAKADSGMSHGNWLVTIGRSPLR